MKFSIDMSIRDMMAEEPSREVMNRILPGVGEKLMENPQGAGMSLRQIAGYTHGAIPQQAVDAVDAALQALNTGEPYVSAKEREQMEFFARVNAEGIEALPADSACRRAAEVTQSVGSSLKQSDAAPGLGGDDHLSVKMGATGFGKQAAVYPGQVWLDTEGRRIHAHGGAIIYADGHYYWYGENKEFTDGVNPIWTWGIRCYRSDDLYNWDDLGLIIPPVLDNPDSDLFPTKHVDRPHIVRSAATGKYACWIKLSGQESCFMVLTADRITGPWETVREDYRPLGREVGDFDLFTDEKSGRTFLYMDDSHRAMVTFALSDDCTEVTSEVCEQYAGVNPPFTREAPAVFPADGRYCMLTSGMTGYVPNQSDGAESPAADAPFTPVGDPYPEDETLSSFNNQISKIFRVEGTDLWIAMGDRWVPEYYVNRERAMAIRRFVQHSSDPSVEMHKSDANEFMSSPMLGTAPTSLANYVWLPITFDEAGHAVMHWMDSWRVEDFA